MEQAREKALRIYHNIRIKTLEEYQRRRMALLKREHELAETFIFDQDILGPENKYIRIIEMITTSQQISVRTTPVTKGGKDMFAFSSPRKKGSIGYFRTLVEITVSTKAVSKMSVSVLILQPSKKEAEKAEKKRHVLHQEIAEEVHNGIVSIHHNGKCLLGELEKYVHKGPYKKFLRIAFSP
jgi:hypothetical protein